MSSLIIGFILGAVTIIAIEVSVDKISKEFSNIEEIKVDHPPHYNIPGRRECIVEMEDVLGAEAVYYFCLGNSFKYRYRKNDKGQRDSDLAKANWYDEYSKKVYERVDWND